MSVFVVRMFRALLLTTLVFVAEVSAEPAVAPLSQKPRVLNNFVVQLLLSLIHI